MAERRGERMADKLGGWVPEFIENEVEREPIIRLAKMITDRIPQKLGLAKITKYDPEYNMEYEDYDKAMMALVDCFKKDKKYIRTAEADWDIFEDILKDAKAEYEMQMSMGM